MGKCGIESWQMHPAREVDVLVQEHIKACEGVRWREKQVLCPEQSWAFSEGQEMEARQRERSHTRGNASCLQTQILGTQRGRWHGGVREAHTGRTWGTCCRHEDTMISFRNLLCGPGRSSGPSSPHPYCLMQRQHTQWDSAAVHFTRLTAIKSPQDIDCAAVLFNEYKVGETLKGNLLAYSCLYFKFGSWRLRVC